VLDDLAAMATSSLCVDSLESQYTLDGAIIAFLPGKVIGTTWLPSTERRGIKLCDRQYWIVKLQSQDVDIVWFCRKNVDPFFSWPESIMVLGQAGLLEGCE
jgi:hypothetical protein